MSRQRSVGAELGHLTLAVNDVIRREFRASAGATGPTFAQFKMLHAIRNGVRHVGKLSERFGISQPATSIMVELMVKDGLIKRVPHATDRRRIELHLTAKASAAIDAIYKRAFSQIDRRLTGLSATRKARVAAQLREIVELLSAPWE